MQRWAVFMVLWWVTAGQQSSCPVSRPCPPLTPLPPLAYAALKARVFPPPGYDPAARPGSYVSYPAALPVNTSFYLVNVQEVRSDLSHAMLTWRVRLTWLDPDLAWAPANATLARLLPRIYVPPSAVWTPPLVFEYNTITQATSSATGLVEIAADGTVRMEQLATVTVSILMSVRNFPFDDQELLTLASFGPYTNYDLAMMSETAGMGDQADQGKLWFDNTEWWIKGFRCVCGLRNLRDGDMYYLYQKAGTPFSLCRVAVRRKAGFYVINFVIPSVAITLLGMIGQFKPELIPMKQPPNKVMIGLAAVMSLALLTITMGRNVPHNDEMTSLHIFYYAMISLTLASCYTSFVRLPAWWPVQGGWRKLCTQGTKRGEVPERIQWWFKAAVAVLHLAAVFLSIIAFSIEPPETLD